ncbi:hypothetical protein [Gelatiniphilus marinus]|uniref:Lipoprotein n=1 Tax=Gelatiniphilus marinus TaxID=1759464 RepID=A0ABW5JSS2_9FLAO
MKTKLHIAFLLSLMLTTMQSCKNCCKEDLEFIKKQNTEILNTLKKQRENLGDFKLSHKVSSATITDLGNSKKLEPLDYVTSVKIKYNSDSTEILGYKITFVAFKSKIESIVLKRYLTKKRRHTKNTLIYIVKYEDSPNSQLISFDLDPSNFENHEEAKKAFESFISGNKAEILKIKLKPKLTSEETEVTTDDDHQIFNERTGIATTTNEVPNDPDKNNLPKIEN